MDKYRMRTHGQKFEGPSDSTILLYRTKPDLLEPYIRHHELITSHACTNTHIHAYALCSKFDRIQVFDLTLSGRTKINPI